MQTVREKWTEERLDDLNERVSDGFARLDGDVRELRGDIKDLRGEMNTRFDALHRLLIRAAGGAIAVFVTTGAALVATQL
jgi:hypothetical protein